VWGQHSYHRIRCDNCDIEFDYYDSLRDASRRWNARTAAAWLPIAGAPKDGRRLMLWDSVSKRPVFGSWRGDNPAITHYAEEPAGPATTADVQVTVVSIDKAEALSRRRVARMLGVK